MNTIYYRVLLATGGGYYIHLPGIYLTAESAFDFIDRQHDFYLRTTGSDDKLQYAVGKYSNQTSAARPEPLNIFTSREDYKRK